MAVKLNRSAFEHAKELVGKGKVVVDERDAWSEHQPSAQEENESFKTHGFGEYGSGILESTTKYLKIPRNTTNFLMEISRRCTAVRCLSAESRAGHYKHFDIERAAAHLHGMIDELGQKVA